jgi:hypothetical protein
VSLPSASLFWSRLSQFLVIRGIYSASYPWQVPDRRANRTSENSIGFIRTELGGKVRNELKGIDGTQ